MTPSNFYFVFALMVFLLALGTTAIVYLRRARQASNLTWSSILERLKAVDRQNIAIIALDVVDELGQARNVNEDLSLDPAQIWPLIGGLEGLETLKHNASVLIDLAFYVQRRYPEAVVVAEQLRLSAREIEWHVARLEGAAKTGKLESAFPSYAQKAVATYYLMTRRLLALYEEGKLPEFIVLQKAIS